MKKLILLVLLVTFSLSSFAQVNGRESSASSGSSDWSLSIGLNAINSLGSRNPFYKPGDWSYEFPIAAAVEFRWSEKFSIEQSITFNGFTTDHRIDSDHVYLTEDYNYLSLDTHVKYYFGRHILPNTDWIDFYANAGIGFFHIDETNLSANLGGGVLVWLNQSRTFGIRGQVIGKFAFNHPESGYDDNHYQYHLQAIFKL